MSLTYREHFRQVMADQGIRDTHGVELLRLIRMLANAYDVVLQAEMREENLSAPRWRLLLHLYMAELRGEAAVSPTQFSKHLNVSKNTISSLLRSLEDQGLIERELDRDDRRQFNIRLSAAGRDLIRSSTPRHVIYLNRLTADLTPDEVVELRELLHKLHVSLGRHGNLAATYCPRDEDGEMGTNGTNPG